MKALILVLTVLVMSVLSEAQTFCITTSDECCDANYNSQSATTTTTIDDLQVTYDAGNENNELHIILVADGTPLESWTVCGCGSMEVTTDPIGSGHVLALKVLCSGCSTPCSAGEGKASLYTPASSTSCKLSCP